MRIHSRKRFITERARLHVAIRVSIVAAALLIACERSNAQQGIAPPPANILAPLPPQPEPSSAPSPIDELKRRLDEQALEIAQLQAQVAASASQPMPPAQPPVPPGSPAFAAPGAPGCPCATVDGMPLCAPAPASAPCCTEINNDKTPMKVYWDSGVWFASTNDDFKIHIGGRIQFDALNAFDVQSSVIHGHGGLNTVGPGTPYWDESQGFRRDRIRLEGQIYDSVDFVWEYDFATAYNPKSFQTVQGGAAGDFVLANDSSVFTGTGITDMFVTLTELPYIGNLSIGSFIVPYSFELSTSDRFGDYCERSAAFDAFCPASNTSNRVLGACAFGWNADETVTYQAVAALNNFWNTGAGFANDDDPLFAGRVTALPYYDASTGGRYLLHLGLSGVYDHCQSDPLVAGSPDSTQFRARLATREYLSPLTPAITNTGVIDGDGQFTEGAELVGVYGPWSWESELYASQVTDDNGAGGAGHDTLSFKGGYASLMYFITGENRTYNRDRGCFERVVPYEDWVRMPGDYGRACGRGAWQIGVRYSYVDLNDMRVYGGQEHEITCGLNWFLNPNLKFQFNYDATYRDNEVASGNAPSNGWISGFGTRFSFDF